MLNILLNIKLKDFSRTFKILKFNLHMKQSHKYKKHRQQKIKYLYMFK